MESRRERNKRDKHERIVAAARDLFAERGFDSVTTQEVSDRADIAAGTLFRYASSKGELILMVHNELFRESIDAGMRNAWGVESAREAITALVLPVLRGGAENRENTRAYQRELMFGAPEEQHRADGLAHVDALITAIAEALESRDCALASAEADLLARTIFSIVHFALISALDEAVAIRQIAQVVPSHPDGTETRGGTPAADERN